MHSTFLHLFILFKVGFQTIIDHMKKFGRVLRMQELTGLYEGLVITFESQTAVKTLTQDIVEHMIGKLKFKTRPFFMTKTIALDPPVDADCVWVQVSLSGAHLIP